LFLSPGKKGAVARPRFFPSRFPNLLFQQPSKNGANGRDCPIYPAIAELICLILLGNQAKSFQPIYTLFDSLVSVSTELIAF